MAGISIWQLVIILGIVVLLFGTKKLRNIGSDLGGAIKGFKGAMKDGENEVKNIEKKDTETVETATAQKEETKH